MTSYLQATGVCNQHTLVLVLHLVNLDGCTRERAFIILGVAVYLLTFSVLFLQHCLLHAARDLGQDLHSWEGEQYHLGRH